MHRFGQKILGLLGPCRAGARIFLRQVFSQTGKPDIGDRTTGAWWLLLNHCRSKTMKFHMMSEIVGCERDGGEYRLLFGVTGLKDARRDSGQGTRAFHEHAGILPRQA